MINDVGDRPLLAPTVAEALNAGCYCTTIDPQLLRRRLEADVSLSGLMATLQRTRPHLFSATSVYVSIATARAMQAAIATIESITGLAQYQALALSRAPTIARLAFGPVGAVMSYDFHLSPAGPRLIEVNTNAGGAMLSAVLASAQECAGVPMDRAVGSTGAPTGLELRFLDVFLREWRLQRQETSPGRLVIVDDDPESQYLWPEFELFRRLFEKHGIEAHVVDAAVLEWKDGRLRYQNVPVDMVYNRLTDFYLAESRHAALRNAYEANAVVLTPHPRAHALHADKRNLAVLSDDELLAAWGVSATDRRLVRAAVPRTRVVSLDNADQLWTERRELFFKPAGGYGAKAAYRGDKLTRRVWAAIREGAYVAQSVVPPAERGVELGGVRTNLKFDVRAYTYAGDVLLLAARMYSGQTTNFRTPGGGFAPVVVVP